MGGIHIPGECVRALELQLDSLCTEVGFPPRSEFKWSPGRELWMRSNLTGEARTEFFRRGIGLARDAGAEALVVIEDTEHQTAGGAGTHEEDVVNLFLERANHCLDRARQGLILVDTPGGDRLDEGSFLGRCLDTIQHGTSYVRFDRIALNVIATRSALVRLLQLADVVTSCTLAYVAGEGRYSPPVFESIRPILRAEYGRVGGVGVKIHPDGRYANLYHWLLGDAHFVRNQTGHPLPFADRPYHRSPEAP